MIRKKSKLRLPICAAAIMIGLQGNTFAVSANEQKEVAPTQVETVTEQEAATTQVEVTEQENIPLKEETQVEEIQDVVTIEEENTQLEADAKDFVIENNVLVSYVGKEKIVTIPSGVTSIGVNAFYRKDNLEEVIIPEGVKSIGSNAFAECINLKKVTISKSLTDISQDAFSGCTKLADAKGFIIVNDIMFDYIGTERKITIPSNVTSVRGYFGVGRFRVDEVTIPLNVKEISESGLFDLASLNESKHVIVKCDVKSNLSFYPHTHVEIQNSAVKVSYSTHVQNIGWQDYKSNGQMSGTSGKSLRVEALKLKIEGNSNLGIQYSTFVEGKGWGVASSDNDASGTQGESRRIEALKIVLTGKDKDLYNVYYKAHIQDEGWSGWVANGKIVGNDNVQTPKNRRIEAIEVLVLPKKDSISFLTEQSNFGNGEYVVASNVSYQTHVQNIGWQTSRDNGETSGTFGKSLRLEGVKINLSNNSDSKGSVKYQTHIQNVGWQEWKKDGELSGTTGKSLRLEAIKIELTDKMAEKYNIYYRVHIQDKGWLAWAKNGEAAGSEGLSKRLEAIEIVILEKSLPEPENYEGAKEKFVK